ncbi:MAG: pilus assembly protein N-terminal domain-containing protein [Clostridium sp.]|nr:pilus assembly protein N-terminal domain-containing protein [Clostridium sp.]
MKYKKRIISLILCLVFITSLFSACSTINPNNINANITKGEWIETLGRYFGMDTYKQSESYFLDVSNDDSFFPYLQSCVEWEIIPSGEKFNPNSKINREYALSKIVYAIGSNITDLTLSNNDDKSAAFYAVDLKIGESKSWIYMHEGLTMDEAEKLLELATATYASEQIAEYDHSKLADGVKIQSLNDANVTHINIKDNKVLIYDLNAKDNYNVGDVVVFGEGKSKKALKITKIQSEEERIILSTESPALEEVYETIDFSSIGSLESLDDIETIDGVEVTSFNSEPVNTNTDVLEKVNVEPLGIANSDFQTEEVLRKEDRIKGAELSLSVSINDKGEIKVDKSISGLKGSASVGTKTEDDILDKEEIENNKKDWLDKVDSKGNPVSKSDIENQGLNSNDLPSSDSTESKEVAEKKSPLSAGYEVKGTISLKDVYIDVVADVTVPLLRVNELSVAPNAKIETSVSVSGKASFEKEIGTLKFMLGSTGFEIDAHLLLSATLSGEVKLSWAINNNTKIEYKNGNLKKTSSVTGENSAEVSAKFEWGVGLRLVLAACFLPDKFNRVLNIDLTIGQSYSVKGKATNLILIGSEKKLYRKGGDEDKSIGYNDAILICAEYEKISPIVKIKFGTDSKTLVNKLKLTFEAELIGKKGIFKKVDAETKHYEIGNGVVKKCSLEGLERYVADKELEEDVTENQTTASNDNVNSLNGLQIDTYALEVEKGKTGTISILSYPEGKNIDDISVQSYDTSIATVTIKDGKIIVIAKKEGTTSIGVLCENTEIKCSIFVD